MCELFCSLFWLVGEVVLKYSMVVGLLGLVVWKWYIGFNVLVYIDRSVLF